MTTFTTTSSPNSELTANDYYQRDADYGLDKNKKLNANLEKLGLKNFDFNNEMNKYMKTEIASYIKNSNKLYTDININEIIENIKSSENYNTYYTVLSNQNARNLVLGVATYDEFYHLCTPDELVYLGW